MGIAIASKSTGPNFHRLLPVGLALIWLVLFFATFSDLLSRWIIWDGSLAHGLPVLIIFFYLLWKTGAWRNQTLLPATLERILSATALVGCSLLWFLAYTVNIQIIEQLLLLPLLILVYTTVFGAHTVFRHRLLLLFLIFVIPIWGSFNGLLLSGSSAVVGNLVRLVEMPALIQGNSIYIPYGHILIADGCSGLRYFVIALALAYLMSYLNGYRESKLLVMLCVAALLGLITNWIRIFILIVIGYKTQMESSLMADHEFFGWVLFGLIFLPAIYFAPVSRRSERQEPAGRAVTPGSMPLLLGLGTMAVGPLAALVLQFTFTPGNESAATLNVEPSGSSSVELPVAVLAPEGGVTIVEKLSAQVFLRIDQYRRNSLDEKLVPYIPRLFDHQYWTNPTDREQVVASHRLRYQELARKGASEKVAQLQWFRVGDKLTSSAVHAKLWQVPATLQGQNRFEVITLQKKCDPSSCDRAEAALMEQAQQILQESRT